MNRRLIPVALALLTLLATGCATRQRMAQLEAELFVAQSQLKMATDRLNALESASAASSNNIVGRTEELEKTTRRYTGRLDTLEANTESISSRLNAELERSQKATEQLVTVKKQLDDHLPQLAAFSETNKKAQEELARLQRDYGQKLRDIENKADAMRTDVNTLTTARDRQTSDVDRRIEELRADFTRRLETTNTDLLTLRTSTKDSLDDYKRALESLSQAVYEVLRLQRQQFTSMRDEFDTSLGKIESLLPKNTLGDAEPGKAKEPAPQKPKESAPR